MKNHFCSITQFRTFRRLVLAFALLLCSMASGVTSLAQDKKAVPDEALVGDWKVSVFLDSEPASPSGYTSFSRLSVAKDGTCVLVGKMDSNRAEYRHRDFATIGTLGAANDQGVMELDLSFQDKEGKPIGKVIWRGIAKQERGVLIIALGRAWSDSRPKSFDDLTAAANQNRKKDETASTPPVTLLVLGHEPK